MLKRRTSMRASKLSCLALLGMASLANGQDMSSQPVELGKVQWRRGFDQAMKQVRAAGKPALLLFQEVPGWSTCKNFGAQVLSHPLIVDAADNSFVPICIYNNTKGDHDAAVLKKFHEKAWNNPVVRFLDSKQKDIVRGIRGQWTVAALAKKMLDTLSRKKRPIPEYLRILAAEEIAGHRGTKTAIFGMGWFWVGEAKFGLIDAVVSSFSGFAKGREVVQLEFDPERISYATLVKRSRQDGCVAPVFTLDKAQQRIAAKIVGKNAIPFTGKVRPDKEPKYYLRKSLLRFLPMTELQAIRINSRMPQGILEKLTKLTILSSSQLAIWRQIKARPKAGWKNVVGKDFVSAWQDANELAQRLRQKNPPRNEGAKEKKAAKGRQ